MVSFFVVFVHPSAGLLNTFAGCRIPQTLPHTYLCSSPNIVDEQLMVFEFIQWNTFDEKFIVMVSAIADALEFDFYWHNCKNKKFYLVLDTWQVEGKKPTGEKVPSTVGFLLLTCDLILLEVHVHFPG